MIGAASAVIVGAPVTLATLQTDGQGHADADRPRPGLLQVWGPAGPVCAALHWTGPLVLGREAPSHALDDPRTSRRHCRVDFDGALWTVEDLGSRNGTLVDGARIDGRVRLDEGQALRVGHCVFVVDPDLRRRTGVAVEPDLIAGDAFAAALRAATRRAAAGEPLLVVGPTGAGKHRVARHYHQAARGERPLIPLAPRRLVEDSAVAAVREAVRAAGDGTLLLSGVEDLGAAAQALLLPLCEPGARPGLCVLARDDLRPQVQRGRLREDLYFRLRAVMTDVPALAHRVEEVAFHVAQVLAAAGTRAQPSLVERCVRRPWPGNVRELRAELEVAAAAARQEGLDDVAARHLRAGAGELADPAARGPSIVSAERLGDPEHVRAVLLAEGGNVRAAARALGVHRNQLRRWIERAGIDPREPGRAADGPILPPRR